MARKTTKKRTTRKKIAKRGRTRKVSAPTKGAAQEELIRSILKKDPEASNGKLSEACSKVPSKYGALNLNRAAQIRISMGISKRRRKKVGRKKAKIGKRTGRAHGRSRKVTNPVEAVQAVLDRMRELEKDAERLRAALEKIGSIATSV